MRHQRILQVAGTKTRAGLPRRAGSAVYGAAGRTVGVPGQKPQPLSGSTLGGKALAHECMPVAGCIVEARGSKPHSAQGRQPFSGRAGRRKIAGLAEGDHIGRAGISDGRTSEREQAAQASCRLEMRVQPMSVAPGQWPDAPGLTRTPEFRATREYSEHASRPIARPLPDGSSPPPIPRRITRKRGECVAQRQQAVEAFLGAVPKEHR